MDIKPRRNDNLPAVPRRQNRTRIGDFNQPRPLQQLEQAEGAKTAPRPEPFKLDTSDIPETEANAKPSKRFSLSALRRNFSWRRFIKRSMVFAGIGVVAGLGYLGFKLFFASQSIIDRDSGGALALQTNIDPSQLNGEGDGRVNILLIGIGGEGHQAGSLADTIIVASIDPFNNDVAMLSIPRDLRVDIPGQWSTKINAAHALGEDRGFSEPGYPSDGPGLLQKTVEDVIGVPIHYYIRVDFNGFKQAVDAVGAISVDVPEAICDYTIAWQFGFACMDAGVQEFNSNQALFYARTRASTRGDFDRGERQRLILMALKDKVLQLGTFSNPLTISNLLDAASGHVRTNLDLPELLRLYEIGETVNQESIISAEITDYITNAGDGTSDYVPRAGSFSEIHAYVRSIFTDGFIKQENASVDVYNGTTTAGLASATADELLTYGYNIGVVDNAPGNDFTATKIYDMTGDNPFTKRYLERRFNAVVLGASDLPATITTEADFVIIVGKDATR